MPGFSIGRLRIGVLLVGGGTLLAGGDAAAASLPSWLSAFLLPFDAGRARGLSALFFPSICSSTIAHALDQPRGTADARSPRRLSLCSGRKSCRAACRRHQSR